MELLKAGFSPVIERGKTLLFKVRELVQAKHHLTKIC